MFHRPVLDKGIRQSTSSPVPAAEREVERSHRIDAEEFYRLLDGVVIDDINILKTRLKEWQDFYNYDRPHGGLDGQTPYEGLRQKIHIEGSDVVDHRQSHSPHGLLDRTVRPYRICPHDADTDPMAWFLRAIEQIDGRWSCQHGRHVYDVHEELHDALQHLRCIATTMQPAELIVHHANGIVENIGAA